MPERITPRPLTAEAFAPFGSVIETNGRISTSVNAGTAQRYDALARVEVKDGGHAQIAIFRSQRRPGSITISMLERHPLGTQAFIPLAAHGWLVVVADSDARVPRCFAARGDQGVQYHANVWHHPLLVLVPEQDFLVVDRAGPGRNLEVCELGSSFEIDTSSPEQAIAHAKNS